MKFSVITCFHNSAQRLERYTRSIQALVCSGFSVEFIFVDNASSDETLTGLQDMAAKFAWPVKVLSEARPGLMYARLSGAAEAAGDFIIFFDDDNEPDSDYLQQAFRLTGQYNACIFTGNSRFPKEYAVPENQLAALEILAIRATQGERQYLADSYCPRPVPWGAGLIVASAPFRAACAAWLETGRQIVGRTGSQPLGGEEIWLIHHMTRKEGAIVFSDKLNLIHRIDKARLTKQYLWRLAFEYGALKPALLDEVVKFKPQLRSVFNSNFVIYLSILLVIKSVLSYVLKPGLRGFLGMASRLGLLYGATLRREIAAGKCVMSGKSK
jgi:glycosyltransferase involved in cell wall biosynthesis